PAAVSALAGVDDPRVRGIEADDPLRAAATVATGGYLVALDADLRYDPEDIPRPLEPVRAGHTTAGNVRRPVGVPDGEPLWYVIGSKALTTAANIIFNCYLSDLETGYKLMPVTLYRSLPRLPHGAVGDAAVTGTLLRRGVRPFEVPVSFHAGSRPVSERAARRSPPRRRGRALLILLRERLRRPPGPP